MLDIIQDTLLDTVKLLPFLFVTFLIIEYIEHKINNKKIITKSKKFGPFFGSLLGVIPQCGISASATNLYATRIISLGSALTRSMWCRRKKSWLAVRKCAFLRKKKKHYWPMWKSDPSAFEPLKSVLFSVIINFG